jgi:hypothetical protein
VSASRCVTARGGPERPGGVVPEPVVRPPGDRDPAVRGALVDDPSTEDDMAYLLHHFWPGGTEAQYRAVVQVVHPGDGLPEGQLYHVAGPTDGGFLITAVWDSRESCERFVKDTLMARLPVEGGFEGRPEERAAEVVALQTT